MLTQTSQAWRKVSGSHKILRLTNMYTMVLFMMTMISLLATRCSAAVDKPPIMRCRACHQNAPDNHNFQEPCPRPDCGRVGERSQWDFIIEESSEESSSEESSEETIEEQIETMFESDKEGMKKLTEFILDDIVTQEIAAGEATKRAEELRRIAMKNDYQNMKDRVKRIRNKLNEMEKKAKEENIGAKAVKCVFGCCSWVKCMRFYARHKAALDIVIQLIFVAIGTLGGPAGAVVGGTIGLCLITVLGKEAEKYLKEEARQKRNKKNVTQQSILKACRCLKHKKFTRTCIACSNIRIQMTNAFATEDTDASAEGEDQETTPDDETDSMASEELEPLNPEEFQEVHAERRRLATAGCESMRQADKYFRELLKKIRHH